ncbi:MAG: dihydroorotase [Spirochaetales bacterium]|jgi:dihydroorotase|nr:dihydroorotase [Spirochaetales bacterium]
MQELVLRRPDDFHVHLRQGANLPAYARRVAADFARALVMPNLKPPVADAEALIRYRNEICSAAPDFQPLMTFKLLAGLSADKIKAMKTAGALAGKYYPEGVTTNAEDGIRGIDDLYPVLEVMEELDIVLCIHGETHDAPVLEREAAFLPQLDEMALKFPRLRMVFEHVSTREAVEMVRALPGNVAATVTVHHLLYTFEDMMASGLDASLYCKPLVKNDMDRMAIQEAVLGSEKKFFYGSDSAPHSVAAKQKTPAAAGVYSAPVSLPLLLEFFESHGALDLIEAFTSEFGADFYGITQNKTETVWEKVRWQAESEIDGAIPLGAGRQLEWRQKKRAADDS